MSNQWSWFVIKMVIWTEEQQETLYRFTFCHYATKWSTQWSIYLQFCKQFLRLLFICIWIWKQTLISSSVSFYASDEYTIVTSPYVHRNTFGKTGLQGIDVISFRITESCVQCCESILLVLLMNGILSLLAEAPFAHVYKGWCNRVAKKKSVTLPDQK